VAEPYGEARDDYAIFCDLAERLGAGRAFSEGRTPRQWLAYLYERIRVGLTRQQLPAPSFEEFWAQGMLSLPMHPDDWGALLRFREDPAAHPLRTPSGKVEIHSPTIAGFGETDSQLDFGCHSSDSKYRGREAAPMHPEDAAVRGIADGDITRLFNARGACLAGVVVTDGTSSRCLRRPGIDGVGEVDGRDAETVRVKNRAALADQDAAGVMNGA
jgi:biotin/methionine sulfoxide reductase